MNSQRLERERRTLCAMIELYCEGRHGTDGLCADCEELHSYAMERLTKCPYGAKKPTCADCPIHCYKPVMRERVREVMRYAGPRMLGKHPVLALLHLWDGAVKKPPRPLRPPRPKP